ncbi:MAG: hypothetical protein JST89_05820 [Cyanobacteria bacterium SZAS-4]|nr:hypothetical protein [Cyanobacteria bacterium SZAS-4]
MINELLIDGRSNSMRTDVSREMEKCGSFATVNSLADLRDNFEQASSIRSGMVISGFGIPVIPFMVPEAEEAPSAAKPRAVSVRRMSARATTSSRRKIRKSQK